MMNKMYLMIFLIFISTAMCNQNEVTTSKIYLPNSDICIKQLKAIGNANLTLVEKLSDGCNPNQMIIGQTQLGLAALKSMERSRRWDDLMGIPNPLIPVIKFLLSKGADPCKVNYINKTAYEYYMYYVVWYPNPEIKELLDVCNN